MDPFLEQAADEAVGSNYGPAGGKFASKDIRVCGVWVGDPPTVGWL